MTRKEEREQAVQKNKFGNFHSQVAYEFGFQQGAEWADRTMLDKVYDFIIANAYKYGKVKFVDNKATFDFRMNTFLNDLKQAMEE